MSTYTQLLYQVVFATKGRDRTLVKEKRPELYRYIWGILQKKKCELYRINGVEDHIHIVTHIHQTISLAALVKDIKVASSDFIKRENLFPGFEGWQDGYAAFTYSIDAKDALVEYVKNQEVHHQTRSFREELIELLQEHGIEYDERYLD